MNNWVVLANSLAVGIFGGVLSAAFCSAFCSRRNRRIIAVGLAVLLILQGCIYNIWDAALIKKIYPLVTHLPLALLLSAITRKRLWPVLCVLTAYLCCQLRRWLALFAVVLFHRDELAQAAVELMITLPLLLLLLHYIAPAVCSIEKRPFRIQWHFGLIPAIYYGFDYLTTVYTNLLAQGVPAVLEFMPFVCCVAYLVFLLYSSAEERKRFQMEQIQNSLHIQVAQSIREISALRESQKQASSYRHDLRHHLQYLLACMENGQITQAQEYIQGICAGIEAQKIQVFCENETVNLILSAFAGRAANAGITVKVQAALPMFLEVSDSDLCVLLSNALENALNACSTLTGGDRLIDVRAYKKEQRLFLQVTNPCGATVNFENGLPITIQPGHGIGVHSICAIVERYGGVYSFSVRDGQFILRLFL